MGIVKQYLKYEHSGTCNIIGSTWPGFEIVNNKVSKNVLCISGACEDILIWDLRKGEKFKCLKSDQNVQITSFSVDRQSNFLAAGFKNGSIKIYDLKTFESDVTFNGHKNAIACLNFDRDAVRLVSGGMDTDIVIWSILNETGMYRLKGHTGPITQALFLTSSNILITCSKDTLVKFWDLETQHCFKTIVEHTTEIYDLLVLKNESLLVTGGADMELRFWKLSFKQKSYDENKTKFQKFNDKINNETDELDIIDFVKLGSISRTGKGHVTTLVSCDTDMYFGCHGTDRKIEIFKIIDDEQINKHLKKREKKLKRKNPEELTVSVQMTLEDEIKRAAILKMSHAVRTFKFLETTDNNISIVALLRNNSFETISSEVLQKNMKQGSKLEICSDTKTCLALQGHKSHIKHVIFSQDGSMFATLSIDSLRLWNRMSMQCIRSIECLDGLTCIFALENRRIIVGSKNGQLNVFDIASGLMIESFEAHRASCNALYLAPDKLGFVSAGSDRMLIFWNFDFPNQDSNNKQLTIKAQKRVEVADEILCLTYSSDQKYVAIGCLDRKAYIFFADSMKMLHTLYSHNQPITCVDISTDTTLIATGSGDKDVKIWSMDFGECRKILKVAHDDRVSGLKFITKTHMFFTCGFDGKIKQWDADSFQLILTLLGHQTRITCISVSPTDGKHVLTSSDDNSVRLWSKTDEILVASEEQEMNRELEEESQIREHLMVAGENNEEIGCAGMKTAETLDAVEKLYEALNVYEEEMNKFNEFQELRKFKEGTDIKPLPINVLFKAFGVTTPHEYVLEVIKKIKSSELEKTLIILPFSCVPKLLEAISSALQHDLHSELAARCLFFLLRIHAGQITSSHSCLPILDDLTVVAPKQLQNIKDTFGFNLAGLNYLKSRIEEKNSYTLFGEAFQKHKDKKKKKRAILNIRT